MSASGAGGKGRADIAGVSNAGADIVALCDVDDNRAANTFSAYSKAKKFLIMHPKYSA